MTRSSKCFLGIKHLLGMNQFLEILVVIGFYDGPHLTITRTLTDLFHRLEILLPGIHAT